MKTLLALILFALPALATEYSFIRTSDLALVQTREWGDVDPRNQNPEYGDGKDYKWVIVVDDAPPAFDPATQKLLRQITITLVEHRRGYQIVALTQEELDGIAAEADRDVKRTDLANSIATLRQWATDAQGTTVTNGNNNAVTQQMVERLGTFFDRFADLLEVQQITP